MADKQMSMAKLREVIKAEYNDAKQFCTHLSGAYYRMRIDVETGSVWSDTYISESTWSVYHSESVQTLYYNYGCESNKINSYLKHAVHILEDAGWEITD